MDNSIAEAVDCRLSHMGITPDSFFSVEFQKEGMGVMYVIYFGFEF